MFVKEFLYVMLFTSVHIFHGLFATFVESLLTYALSVIIMNIENKCMTHEQQKVVPRTATIIKT